MNPKEPIAIVGIGCRFPGGIHTPDELWTALKTGRDAITAVPAERWSANTYSHLNPATPGRTYSNWGGFLSEIDQFDAGFFGISPREAARTDPQQRLMLEMACEALEDAGIPLDSMSNRKAGVFIGISSFDYGGMQCSPNERYEIDAYTNIGSALCICANRISYFLNLKGPSLAVDTACSSSLVATHMACQSLWSGECEMAFSGGVSLILRPEPFIGFSKAGMLAPDGKCKSFDARANGYVRAEGAGMIVLKPLASAIRDRDPVYALIRATAVNQDGRTAGLSVPNGAAQESMLRDVLAQAGLSGESVQYIEAHGTGTPVGDPIEARAIGAVFGSGRQNGDCCWIGSIKSNVGHMEAASGIAGLAKATLCLQHGAIPANPTFTTKNPAIPFDELCIRVAEQYMPWPPTLGGPRRAGVNSFGFGGTNAHILMESYDAPQEISSDRDNRPRLVPISAQSNEALRGQARAMAEFLEDGGGNASLAEIGYTASCRRTHHSFRLATVVQTKADLKEQLQAFLNDDSRATSSAVRIGPDMPAKPVLIFSGMGQQWAAMGRQLLDTEPVYAAEIQTVDAMLCPLLGLSLRDALLADASVSRVQETWIAQPAIFATQIALAALWRSWGVEPQAVVGHSVGEAAAAVIAGALTLEDGVSVIYHRSRLQQRAAGAGRMLAVGLSEADANGLVREYADAVSVAAINSARSVTLSGEENALHSIAERLEQRSVFHRFLNVEVPYHSHFMDPLRTELEASLEHIRPRRAKIPLYSTVTGSLLEGTEIDAAYWWKNVRQPVQFYSALNQILKQGHTTLLEIGGQPVLATAAIECLEELGKTGMTLPSLRRNRPELETMLSSAGKLHESGMSIAWERIYSEPMKIVSLPRYAWQRERYWHETEYSRRLLADGPHPLLGVAAESSQARWRLDLDNVDLAYLQDHLVQGAVVFPGAGYVEMALAALKQAFGNPPFVIEDMSFDKPLFLKGKNANLAEIAVDRETGRFAVTSEAGQSGEWATNASATIRAGASRRPQSIDVAAIEQRCATVFKQEDCYQLFERSGLQYGPMFQGLKKLRCGAREALAEISLPDGLPVDDRYLLHPVLLDCAFQALLGAMADYGGSHSLFLPVRIGKLVFHGACNGSALAHVKLTSITDATLKGDIRVFDRDGYCVADVTAFECHSLGSGRDALAGLFYEDEWRLQPLPGRATGSMYPSVELPTPAAIAIDLREEVNRLSTRWARDAYHSGLVPLLTELSEAYVFLALKRLGWNRVTDYGEPVASVAERLGIAPHNYQLFDRLLGAIRNVGDPETRDMERLQKTIRALHPSAHAELAMVSNCGEHLAEVLQGTVDPLELLFPAGSSATAEYLYQDSPTYRVYNLLIQHALQRIVDSLPEGRRLRILEIGGGTGGLTAWVLPILPVRQTHYVFTDVSALLVSEAEQKFSSFPFVEYRTLDIETELWDADAHGFDIILASDVLHATRSLRDSLTRVKRHLASNGLLLMLEGTATPLFAVITFGLLKGWWLFEDFDVRASDPWVSQQQWASLLEEAGFNETSCVSDNEAQPWHSVIIARGPEVEHETEIAPDAVGEWLILSDEKEMQGSTARSLAGVLQSRGGSPMVLPTGGTLAEEATARPDLRGVIFLADATSFDEKICGDDLGQQWNTRLPEYTQAITALGRDAAPPPLWLVTRRAQWVDGDQAPTAIADAPLWGLGRVAGNEYPQLAMRMIDVQDASDATLNSLVDELCSADAETEIALRDNARYVRRLKRVTPAAPATPLAEAQPFRLEPSEPGLLENFVAVSSTPEPPKSDWVLIEVVTAALNFKDVMLAMKLLPPEAIAGGASKGALGMECAGRVVAAGAGVPDYRAGDEVIAMASGTLASHVTVRHELVMRKPSHLTFEDAATTPVAFLTAYYALNTLGRLQPGERVLIHAATGGVGLAAIQLAQTTGAEIYATAGSPAKRRLLQSLGVRHIMDSRTLYFADEIMEQTSGEGVDLVLNSLSGEAIPKSLSVLRPYGRFIEIGKRDIYQNSKIGLRPFGDNLSFFAVDLDRLCVQRPATARALIRDFVALLESRTVHALPYRTFSATRAGAALKYLAQAKHTGKVLIAMDETSGLPVRGKEKKMTIRPDSTYVITGGLGGAGLAFAEWLVDRGAKYLALIGRSGASSPESWKAVEALQRRGVETLVFACDVSEKESLAQALRSARLSLPPIRGVIHGAMVLDDCLLQNMTRDRLWKVMSPKAMGAWNLHELTIDDPIEMFLLLSSITSMVGNPGQGNYVAANSFLDGLAHYRRQLGLPALTVNWGALADAGYVARNAEVGARMEQVGLRSLPMRMAFEAVERLLKSGAVQTGVSDVDWSRIKKTFGARYAPRLSELMLTSDEEVGGEIAGRKLQDAAPEERSTLATMFLRDQIARVMGMVPAKIDIHGSLLSLGLDSLMAVEMRNRIQMETGIDIPPVKIMEGVSIAGLADFIVERLNQLSADRPKPELRREFPVDSALTVEAISSLTDEEVEQHLQLMLANAGGDDGSIVR